MRDRDHREAIEKLLRDELDGARSDYEAAYLVFDLLVKDVTNGSQPPDGEMRLQQSGDVKRGALRNYTRALTRFAHFTLSGTVPDDLLPLE
jgi:hypothetical protein